MIAKTGPALYKLNLIRDLREKEKRTEQRNRLTVILGVGCFGLFVLSLLYSGLTIWQMERVLTRQSEQVSRLRQEYQKYTATKLIVDKSDFELLSSLQGKGYFWTKKLAAMAKHLPDNYWITGFSYDKNLLRVTGYGYATAQQDQLLILDQYLNGLRADSAFAGTFKKIQLNDAERKEDGGKVFFDFSAFTSSWKAQ
jgi:Tfp pilus assembly protein PilN